MSERARAELRALVADRAATGLLVHGMTKARVAYQIPVDTLDAFLADDALWSEPLVVADEEALMAAIRSGVMRDDRDVEVVNFSFIQSMLRGRLTTRAQVVAALAEDEALVERVAHGLGHLPDFPPDAYRRVARNALRALAAALAAPADGGRTG